MRLILIGFSGTGKSYWANRLESECGYERVCMDDLIEEQLEPLLPPGASGTGAVSAWMGQPNEPQYVEREEIYLEAEREALKNVVAKGKGGFSENAVFDTTGSVIYCGAKYLDQLKSFGTVVHLAIDDEDMQQMFDQFLSDPKPVLWQGLYGTRPGESHLEALKRCYPKLVRYRLQRYAALAHKTIPARKLREAGFADNERGAEALLNLLK